MKPPTFENDKVRMWANPSDADQHIGDPTMIQVDMDHEEIYESRTYEMARTTQAIEFLKTVAQSNDVPEQVLMPVVTRLMADTGFKVLAKRHLCTGLISALFLGTAGGTRTVLRELKDVSEDEYRDEVERFERRFPAGVLADPLVCTLEEWREISAAQLDTETRGSQ